jgi:hypothetical protein
LPTKPCRFQQSFVDSDTRLSFPTSALSENHDFRNWKTDVTACRTRVPASRCDLIKERFTHTDRDNYMVPSANVHAKDLLELGAVGAARWPYLDENSNN